MEKELLVMNRKQTFSARKIDSATHKWFTLPRWTDARNLCHSYRIWYGLQITSLALDLQLI